MDKYSESMKLLATSFWESSGEESRVQWIKSQVARYQCQENTYTNTLFQVESYFWGGGVAREARKDQKRLWRSQGNAREEGAIEKAIGNGDHNFEDKILEEGNRKDSLRVLDVGSCYNPFGELEGWQVKMM